MRASQAHAATPPACASAAAPARPQQAPAPAGVPMDGRMIGSGRRTEFWALIPAVHVAEWREMPPERNNNSGGGSHEPDMD